MFILPLSWLLLLSFVTPVFAGSDQAFDVMSLLPIVLIFGVFYFLLLRPQQKKMKTHQQLLANLKKGDRVTTSGGIIGVVQKTTDTEVVLDVGDNVRLTFLKQMVTDVMNNDAAAVKSAPAKALPKDKKKPLADKKSTPSAMIEDNDAKAASDVSN